MRPGEQQSGHSVLCLKAVSDILQGTGDDATSLQQSTAAISYSKSSMQMPMVKAERYNSVFWPKFVQVFGLACMPWSDCRYLQ